MVNTRKAGAGSARGYDATRGHLAQHSAKHSGLTQLTHASTQHLLHRAGIATAGSETDLPIRGFVQMKLYKLLKKSLLSMDYAKRTTLLKEDVKKATKLMHLPVFAMPLKESGQKGSVFLSCRQDGAPAAGAISAAHTNAQEVRAQKKSSCLIIPKQRFKRMAKDIVKMLHPMPAGQKIKLREGALDLLQIVIEHCTIVLLEKAHVVALSGERKRVYPKDIETAFLIVHGPA